MANWLTSSQSRRRFLATTAAIAFAGNCRVDARTIRGGELPWRAYAAEPPTPARPGPWLFFTYDEATAIESMVDRLIPADDLGVGGREAGCAVFIDRQLAGFFGDSSRLYMRPPFVAGTPSQGAQSPLTPTAIYRAALAAIDAHCKSNYGGKPFQALQLVEQDAVLTSLDKNELKLANADGKTFFELLLQNTMEGFFADPLYGGNRDMAGWKLVGFPGARYDYRDHVAKHNQPYPLPPVSIMGRSEWSMVK
ncbi:gluconate 2-dehydrogenase subunit 3 family protein [Terrarubrum flagellatum]|uniref:gluconate 2-dehydrogenase subunit 3 family protein n=1 Tax=Terrirubrum flagellatum TaxID=2895980 RepID=UPI003144F9DE